MKIKAEDLSALAEFCLQLDDINLPKDASITIRIDKDAFTRFGFAIIADIDGKNVIGIKPADDLKAIYFYNKDQFLFASICGECKQTPCTSSREWEDQICDECGDKLAKEQEDYEEGMRQDYRKSCQL